MISWRIAVLFVHVTAVIVALGGSLFSTFALTPILVEELDPPLRLRITRRIIRRLGVIVLTALAVLVFTGFLNVMFIGEVSSLLAMKLAIVTIVIVLAIYQYANLGAQIWGTSVPGPELAKVQRLFRRVGITVGTLVLAIVYLSLGLTRVSQNQQTNQRANRAGETVSARTPSAAKSSGTPRLSARLALSRPIAGEVSMP
jgi:uncharacterized membrane protein